uniref:Embryonic polarity protein dorsal n=2 Tax=Cacopsylla melanoneura TaxID=428564 RepID=A0A8D8R1L7_9HEMI
MDTSPADTSTDQTSSSISLTGIDWEALLKEVMKSDEHHGTMKSSSNQPEPFVEILEQPKLKVRFRYECEGRSAGSIMGKESTNEAKTYPTIRIRNYKGIAHVVVSCVTVDNPPKPHPHKLVGKEHCKNGIFAASFSHENNEEMRYAFTNLGIQCMKKKDIKASLEERKKCNVNPFDTQYDPNVNQNNINLNAVRLCFQVFLPLEQAQSQGTVMKLTPVVSEPIFDAKSNADLAIVRLSHTSASVAGGMEMILLCDKVNKDDIRVRFFEEKDGMTVWEEYGDFNEKDVHKQFAIVLKTPPYMRGVDNLVSITDPIDIQIQLVNQKGTKFSEPVDFKLTPIIMNSGRNILWRYRKNKAQPLPFTNLLQNTGFLDNIAEEKKDNENRIIEDDYASVDKSVGGKENTPCVTVSSDQMETDQVPDVTTDRTDDRFEELLNEVSNLNNTLQEESSFLLIEDNNTVINNGDTLDALDQFNNNVNESSVTIEELVDFPDLDEKQHLGPRTEGFGSYSSLQLAMKNQYFLDRNSGGECYEDVLPPEELPTPPPEVATPPPRPPSHTKPDVTTLQRKSNSEKFASSLQNNDSIPPLPPKRVRKSGVDRNLPPVPRYKSFFQKLFSKRKSKSKPSTPRERSLSVDSRKVGGGGSINDDVMMTEAEHYALYTSVAPHATQSEFDEASFYYSPVEGLTVK